MKKKFKIGDRVICTTDYDGNKSVKNKVGTIRDICDESELGVEFDTDVRGHDLCGNISNNNGWYVNPKYLKPIEKIVIYREGNDVIALDTVTNKKGVARCNPEDTFDFGIGAKLALERLTAKCTFKILCLDNFSPKLKKGKTYEFIDGVTKWENNGKSFYYVNFNDFIRQNPMFSTHVIEIKDGDNVDELLKKHVEIKLGDNVAVINIGQTYTRYSTWTGLTDYKNHFVVGKDPIENKTYKVLNVAKHNDKSCKLALIQDPDTTQVFIVGVDGLKKDI